MVLMQVLTQTLSENHYALSGIRSIVCRVSVKCMQLAKVKPPFEIFLVRICPAKS